MLISVVMTRHWDFHKMGIDMSRAFDTINREKILDVLSLAGCNADDLRLVCILLVGTNLTVRIKSSWSAWFETTIGSPKVTIWVLCRSKLQQPIAACTRAQSLTRPCLCATCIWLLHPAPPIMPKMVLTLCNLRRWYFSCHQLAQRRHLHLRWWCLCMVYIYI